MFLGTEPTSLTADGMPPPDDFDPNNWDWSPIEYRMYAGHNADHVCRVDYEDYLFFTRWLWAPKWSRPNKVYFKRTEERGGSKANKGNRNVITIYLHVEVCTRAWGPPPDSRRIIPDHTNGNSLDNRRHNLRWATAQENRLNRCQ